MRVLFDANALTELCADGSFERAARLRLRAEIKQHRTRVVATGALLSELAGLFARDAREYRRQVRELRHLCRSRLLRPWLSLVRLEVGHGGRLPDRIAFQPEQASRAAFHRALASGESIATNAADVRSRKARYAENETVERAAYRETLGVAAEGKRWSKRFGRFPLDVIDEATVEVLRRHASTLGLTGCGEGSLPLPRLVPTLRADVAYHIARINLVTLEAAGTGGAIDGSDLYDNRYFAQSVYADVLVTNDEAFHRIAQQTANVGAKLERFCDWARR
jgi:hypothetical protein